MLSGLDDQFRQLQDAGVNKRHGVQGAYSEVHEGIPQLHRFSNRCRHLERLASMLDAKKGSGEVAGCLHELPNKPIDRGRTLPEIERPLRAQFGYLDQTFPPRSACDLKAKVLNTVASSQ